MIKNILESLEFFVPFKKKKSNHDHIAREKRMLSAFLAALCKQLQMNAILLVV